MYLYRPTHIELKIKDTSRLQGEHWRMIAGYSFQLFGNSRNAIEVIARRKDGLLQFSLDSTVEGKTRRGKWGEQPGKEAPQNYMIQMPADAGCIKLHLAYNWKEREYDADYMYQDGKMPEQIGHIHVQFFHWWPVARRLFIPLEYARMIEESWY